MTKTFLFFLGSGASVPFELPTMIKMVNEFETFLQSQNKFDSMLKLYDSIKENLLKGYGYANLESVFSVIEFLSTDSDFTQLGFTSTHLFAKSKLNIKKRISTSNERDLARKLSKLMRNFVRRNCTLKGTQRIEQEIRRVYSELFEAVCHKYGIQRMTSTDKTPYYYPNCRIYTTNYDLVLETYWEGLAYINDLWKPDNNMQVLDVAKSEGDLVTLIKLHGSLNWFKLADGTIARVDSNKKRIGNQKIAGDLMLYPIQQKDLYLYPWFNLFWRFKDDLIHTKNWITIGYGFNDEFIRNTIDEVLKENDHSLIIVSPEAINIKNKFSRSNKKYIKPIVGKFGTPSVVPKIINALI